MALGGFVPLLFDPSAPVTEQPRGAIERLRMAVDPLASVMLSAEPTAHLRMGDATEALDLSDAYEATTL